MFLRPRPARPIKTLLGRYFALLLASTLACACDSAATSNGSDAGNTAMPGAASADSGAFSSDGGLPTGPVAPASANDAAVTGSVPTDGSAGPESGPDGSVSTGAVTLPAVSDLKLAGPFTPASGAGPNGYVLFYPKELGKNGVKHPIVSFGPGAVENAGSFSTLLNHLASHGFVVLSFDGTPQGAELTKGIDWLVAENARADSMLYQKLDITKVAAGGHSAGSIATFVVAKDARLTTTLHISGGTFDPHTDIANLHAPALFICGESGGDGLLAGDVARANCDIDFDNVKVPVFYGVTKGAAHMTPTEIGDPALRTLQMAAIVGWLRFQLANDAALKGMFVGSACTLCSDPGWAVKQKNWN